MKDDELLQLILDDREWQTFECKRAAVQPAKLLEVVCAFANTDGGILVIGLDDPEKVKEEKKRLIGISENLDNVSEFLKFIGKEIEPPFVSCNHTEINIENAEHKADKILVVSVGKSNDVHSLKKGDTFVRKGRQNVKIGSSEIVRLKYEKGTVRFEDEDSLISDLSILRDRVIFSIQKGYTERVS